MNSFLSSNVSEKLTHFEREIEVHQDSLMELAKKREELERMINKLKKDVATAEIGKRDLLDNMSLRKVKELLEVLKEQYADLREKVKSMNYDEIVRKWELLEGEKQILIRQVSHAFDELLRETMYVLYICLDINYLLNCAY